MSSSIYTREQEQPQARLVSSAITILLLFLLFPCTSSLSSSNGSTKTRREVITVKHGAIATDDGRCSHIGRAVLREGGHAVDASVAVALCLGVVSPASSGIGGGAFMLIRLANGQEQAFDMRETAPLLASQEISYLFPSNRYHLLMFEIYHTRFCSTWKFDLAYSKIYWICEVRQFYGNWVSCVQLDQNMYAGNAALKASGALSIAVPGELAGLHEAWKQHGRLAWDRLVRPAERLAERGFRISPYLHMQMDKTKSAIFSDKGLRDIFTSNGTLLQPGSICYNKKLAQTLRVISKHGPEAFYNGSIGSNLVKDVRKIGGILTNKDLQRYHVKVKEPLSVELLGLKILGMPPPSSGGVGMTLIVNILSQYGVPSGVSGSLGLHRLVEALKHVFAVKMNLGDPDFVDVSEVMSDMLSLKFAKELKKTIFDNMTFGPNHYGGRWNQNHEHGTSHLSIVDSERNAVSMTTTVNSYFGSQFLSPTTGILLNNEMDDFSVPGNGSTTLPPPAPANFIIPSKRPLSSMAPTIVLKDGQLKAVVGASGGAMIIAGTTEVFLNHFAKKMDPLSSVMAPRTYHQLIPNVLLYENWTTVTGDHFEVPTKTRQSLQKKGHVLQSLAGGTICQLIVHEVNDSKAKNGVILGELTAVSDPRKGGLPSGY